MINLDFQDETWINSLWDKLKNKLEKTAVICRDIIPYTTENGKYVDKAKEEPAYWTNGFFGGLMWLMYNATKNEEFRKTAESQEKILNKAFLNFEDINHDVGFMWGLTAKANYILNGNTASRQTALYAANILAARTNVKAGFIRAWSWCEESKKYTIIDSLMNLPLLYWASEEINDPRFKYFALMQADVVMNSHIREDGSVIHIAVHDENTGEVIGTLGGQGYKNGSTWSRGQAWAIYGFTLNYIYSKEIRYLETAKRVADYFVNAVKKSSYKVLTDFNAPEVPVLYDNTAALCSTCGLIELYKITGNKEYLDTAIKVLKRVVEDCIFDDSDESIVQNCMEKYSVPIEQHIIYGDFYLCEAILKLKNEGFLIW